MLVNGDSDVGSEDEFLVSDFQYEEKYSRVILENPNAVIAIERKLREHTKSQIDESLRRGGGGYLAPGKTLRVSKLQCPQKSVFEKLIPECSIVDIEVPDQIGSKGNLVMGTMIHRYFEIEFLTDWLKERGIYLSHKEVKIKLKVDTKTGDIYDGDDHENEDNSYGEFMGTIDQLYKLKIKNPDYIDGKKDNTDKEIWVPYVVDVKSSKNDIVDLMRYDDIGYYVQLYLYMLNTGAPVGSLLYINKINGEMFNKTVIRGDSRWEKIRSYLIDYLYLYNKGLDSFPAKVYRKPASNPMYKMDYYCKAFCSYAHMCFSQKSQMIVSVVNGGKRWEIPKEDIKLLPILTDCKGHKGFNREQRTSLANSYRDLARNMPIYWENNFPYQSR